jgi:subtilisin-like proprotein convertase family protein
VRGLRIGLGTAAIAAATAIAPAPAAAGIFQQCQDLSAPIPDFNSAQAVFDTRAAKAPPPKGSKVRKVIVSLKITHALDQDLILTVSGPTGRRVTLAAGLGGTGDNYGTGTDCGVAGFTSFFDGAPTPITSGTAPFEGSFKPQFPLAALKGLRARGIWTVRVGDGAPGNVGALEAVRLNVESTNPKKSRKKKGK